MAIRHAMNFVVNYYYIMYWCMITNNLKHNIHIMCTQFCIKLCKNTSVLLNIDRYQMSSAYVVFIIKCMRRKNVFSTAFVFFSLCYMRQKHLPCGLIKSSSMWHFPQKLSIELYVFLYLIGTQILIY